MVSERSGSKTKTSGIRNNKISIVHIGGIKIVNMRRDRNPPQGSILGIGPTSFQEGNPEVWV